RLSKLILRSGRTPALTIILRCQLLWYTQLPAFLAEAPLLLARLPTWDIWLTAMRAGRRTIHGTDCESKLNREGPIQSRSLKRNRWLLALPFERRLDLAHFKPTRAGPTQHHAMKFDRVVRLKVAGMPTAQRRVLLFGYGSVAFTQSSRRVPTLDGRGARAKKKVHG